jgi:hypothetical protein
MHDVFNGYYNLLNGTLDMVVHEWSHDLNIGFENLGFQIAGISNIMHYWCPKTLIYVHVTCVFFQHTINQVQRQCSKTITKLNDEFEKQLFAQDVVDALGVVYPQ